MISLPTKLNCWYDSWDDVIALATHLVNDHAFSATNLLSFFEKPWKWSDEYHLFRELGTAFPEDDGWTKCQCCCEWVKDEFVDYDDVCCECTR